MICGVSCSTVFFLWDSVGRWDHRRSDLQWKRIIVYLLVKIWSFSDLLQLLNFFDHLLQISLMVFVFLRGFISPFGSFCIRCTSLVWVSLFFWFFVPPFGWGWLRFVFSGWWVSDFVWTRTFLSLLVFHYFSNNLPCQQPWFNVRPSNSYIAHK